MRRDLAVVPRIARDLNEDSRRWLPAWMTVGALASGVAGAFSPMLGLIAAVGVLALPPAWLASHALLLALRFWSQDGLVLLLDETVRVFRQDATVVELWTRELRNSSNVTVSQQFDIPMFWDKPLRTPYVVALYWGMTDRTGRRTAANRVIPISATLPEYSERLFEGRKFYGAVISHPIELAPGATGSLRLTYDGDIALPADDQIIRARGRVLRMRWIGMATDGLVFDAHNCYVEVKEADPVGHVHRRETARARRYLATQNDGTRLLFDLPRPIPGFHYRVRFAFREPTAHAL